QSGGTTSRVGADRLRSDLTTARSTAIDSTPNRQTETPIARKKDRHIASLLYANCFSCWLGQRSSVPRARDASSRDVFGPGGPGRAVSPRQYRRPLCEAATERMNYRT